jgi:hypothetical protein
MNSRTCDVHASGTIDLYFYGELTPAGRESAERHLAGCDTCRDALRELGEIRAALAARPDVSAPPPGDWSGFMARLESAIEREAAPAVMPFVAPARPVHGYAAYVAMAALVALVTIGVVFVARHRTTAPVTIATSQPAGITPAQASGDQGVRSLVALSEQHFERSKLVVLGLAAKDPEHATGADWEYERTLASSLLGDTRLYRMAAEEHGLMAVAGVMRDLEVVLLQASLSDQADAETLGQIQRLIRTRDLLTKMNVVTTRGL